MALPNALGLIFSTMSVANAIVDIPVLRAPLYPATEFNKKRGLHAPAIESVPAYQYRYAEGVRMGHQIIHGATISTLIWSLTSVRTSRYPIFVAMIFEIASLAVAPLLLSVMEEIFSAKRAGDVVSGTEKLIRRQVLRNAFLHVPCMLCCLWAVLQTSSRP